MNPSTNSPRKPLRVSKSAAAMMPYAVRELPYPNAKEMLLVDDLEDRDFLADLLEAVAGDLPDR